MSGLVLNLKPWETFLVGPHLLQNGPKKAQIRIRDDQAGVLRLRDALHPEQVSTPLSRAYYTAQLLLLEPHAPGSDHKLLSELIVAARDALPAVAALSEAEHHCEDRQYYRVMRALRPLLPAEALLLSQVQYRTDCDQELCKAG